MLVKLQQMIELIRMTKVFAFDTETTGVDIMADFIGISFATWGKEGVESIYIDVRDINKDTIVETIRTIFEDESILKIGHNLKYDWIQIRKLGLDIKGKYFDTMLAYWYLDPGSKRVGLKKLVKDLYAHDMETYNDMLTKYGPIEKTLNAKGKEKIKRHKAKTLLEVPVEDTRRYGIADSYWTMMLYDKVLPELKEFNKERPYNLLEMIDLPLLRILVNMELEGIGLDLAQLTELCTTLKVKLDICSANITSTLKELGQEINIQSNAQLSKLLFETLEMKVIKKTEMGVPAVDEEVLEKLGKEEGIGGTLCKNITDYRKAFKMLSTYVNALPKFVVNGRIHPNYNIHGTATGRLSCDSPNLQNIPKEGEEAKLIRKAFVPKEGHLLIRLDYQQMELRMLANVSHDAYLTYALRSGKDLHTYTGQKIFNKEVLTEEERGFAKTINFGIIYGMTEYSLMKRINVPLRTASNYIHTWFRTYPGVKAWERNVVSDAYEHQTSVNFLGRLRTIRTSGSISNIAMNTPIQGGASELVKIAMIRLDRYLPTYAKIVLQVHDELVIECPKEHAEKVSLLAQSIMESSSILPEFNWYAECPFTVESSVGNHWMDDTTKGNLPGLVPNGEALVQVTNSKAQGADINEEEFLSSLNIDLEGGEWHDVRSVVKEG
jgi:DNA polymerase-1